jgi:hypothetical protein
MKKNLQKVSLITLGLATIAIINFISFADIPPYGLFAQELLKENLLSKSKSNLTFTKKVNIEDSNDRIEKKVSYASIITSNFDFDLTPTSDGKFNLSFYNPYQKDISIKVYDIIGNLVMEEKINMQGRFKKEYDLSSYNTKLFIVEVGSSKYNLTKRINT